MTKMRNSAASGRGVKRIEKLFHVSGYDLSIYSTDNIKRNQVVSLRYQYVPFLFIILFLSFIC